MARKTSSDELKSNADRARQTENFDVAFDKLKSVVEKMETGGLGLDETLALFEEGVGLSKTLFETLNIAEGRVDELLANLERTPFTRGE